MLNIGAYSVLIKIPKEVVLFSCWVRLNWILPPFYLFLLETKEILIGVLKISFIKIKLENALKRLFMSSVVAHFHRFT